MGAYEASRATSSSAEKPASAMRSRISLGLSVQYVALDHKVYEHVIRTYGKALGPCYPGQLPPDLGALIKTLDVVRQDS